MTGNVTWDVLIGIAGIVVAAFAVWWQIESRVEKAKTAAYYKVDEANTKIAAASALAGTAREELASYKTHVAETYVSKAGMREQTEQIIGAIKEVKSDVHGINQRMDRIVDNNAKARPSSD